MSAIHSDALVFFGATGDLAYKKIFPSLQSMVKRGHLHVPIIGVAKAGWNLEQLKARAKDSLEKHGGLDPAAWEKLSGLLHYVDGDYNSDATFQNLRKELGNAQHPAHYLAIPPMLFGEVVEQLVKSGCAEGSRVIVENIRVNDEVWLQQHIAVNIDVRVALLKNFNLEIDVSDRDYKKFRSDTKIIPLGEARSEH